MDHCFLGSRLHFSSPFLLKSPRTDEEDKAMDCECGPHCRGEERPWHAVLKWVTDMPSRWKHQAWHSTLRFTYITCDPNHRGGGQLWASRRSCRCGAGTRGLENNGQVVEHANMLGLGCLQWGLRRLEEWGWREGRGWHIFDTCSVLFRQESEEIQVACDSGGQSPGKQKRGAGPRQAPGTRLWERRQRLISWTFLKRLGISSPVSHSNVFGMSCFIRSVCI